MADALERLLGLYNRLRRGPLTIETAALWAQNNGLNISKRQLYRDLSKLASLHLSNHEHIIEDIGEKGIKIWRLATTDADSTKLTQRDLHSFYLMKAFIPTCVYENRKKFFEKLEKWFYKSVHKSNFQIIPEINDRTLAIKDYWNWNTTASEDALLDELIWAIEQRKKIRITYLKVNNYTTFKHQLFVNEWLIPMQVLFCTGKIYLACVTEKEQKLICYTLHKELQVEIGSERYKHADYTVKYNQQLISQFGLGASLDDGTIHNIELRVITPYAQDIMEYMQLHSSQRWERENKEWYRLHLTCEINHQLLFWICGGADSVEVIQPKILKELVQKGGVNR
ncbi:MAG TPA: hypothetical protein DCQ29_01155 [Chitinophagaceae bacterium]|nr:hypothetical protein [Chitinophagaceae bacterium]